MNATSCVVRQDKPGRIAKLEHRVDLQRDEGLMRHGRHVAVFVTKVQPPIRMLDVAASEGGACRCCQRLHLRRDAPFAVRAQGCSATMRS